jgi:hypothetical protein
MQDHIVKWTPDYGNKIHPAHLERLNDCQINETKYTLNDEGKIDNSYAEGLCFFSALAECRGLKFIIKEIVTTGWVERLGLLKEAADTPAAKVIVPGLGLLSITSTRFLKNPSEEELNERLAAGWKILAVLPLTKGRCNYQLGKPEIKGCLS